MLVLPWLVASCSPEEAPPGSSSTEGATFREIAAEAGITHRHHRPVLDPQLANIMPWMTTVGAAAAAGDFDNDGWVDLYLTDSRKGESNHLYRNNGDGTFTEVGPAAGVAACNDDGGVSMDAVWGDVDNDGWQDLFVVRWGFDLLFRNNGDGTFTDVTAERFVRPDGAAGTRWKNGNAAIFFDYDLDGRLDLYVGNYFKDQDLWHLTTTRIMHDSFEDARNADANQLFHQESDGSFREAGAAAGVEDVGWTLAVGSVDLDNDGWPDLYAADDFGPDQLYLNRGDGTFDNASDTALGYDTKKGMNIDFGDYNNDGWLDGFVTNITTAEYLQEGNMLWHNNGPGSSGRLTLTDISVEAGTYDGGWGWGAKFLDYDNDGDLDIVSVNGFISAGKDSYWYDLASWTVTGIDTVDARNWPAIHDRSFSGYEATRFWVNDGLSSFAERAKDLGVDSVGDGRGVVTFDYDNDGDLDIFIANQGQPAELYRNGGTTGNDWLAVQLEADPSTGTNRDGIGTRVTVVTQSHQLIRERDGGNGYAAQSDPRLYFGLGRDQRVELLEVRWPDGGLQYLEGVEANRLVQVHQDPSQYASKVKVRVANPERRLPHEQKPPLPAIDPAVLERQLAELEDKLRQRPSGYALDATYRAYCAAHGQHDRAVDFFQEMVQEHPSDMKLRTELALAYVDKIPTCGGIAAVVCKGRLARRSLDQLDLVVDSGTEPWISHYCRGMNHLHWPRALRHSDSAVEDLTYCIRMQRSDGNEDPEPYYLRTHVALGDAYAKAGDYGAAREAWRAGEELFPEAEELRARLAITDDRDLLAYVEDQRSLEQPIDTDLSFLDRQR